MPELVALAMPSGPALVDEIRRTWDAGDGILPVDLRLPPAGLDRLFEAMAPSVIIDEHGERHARHGGRDVVEGDALVIATSGTTGEPKGVVHTHASIRASAERTSERLGVTGDDQWLACLPPAHIGGLAVIMRSIVMGTRLTVHNGFDADAVAAAARDGATLISLVTAALRRIDTSLFRCILLGGAAPPQDRAANVIATYGMTETGSGIVYDQQALRDVELRVDADGQLLVRSPTLLRCYRNGTDPRIDGWFPTGDAASIDDRGVLQVHGRMNDVITTGGEMVWPAAVESILRRHPAVDDVLVHGAPDDAWGERVVASIESAAPPSLGELRELVKQELPAFAAPKELRVVERLERTNSGKIRRPARR